jgi:Tol biopolymer transport system component
LRRISAYATDVDWAPDGAELVVAGKETPRFCSDLSIISADGKIVRRLTHTSSCERAPSWSPDGRRVAYELHDDRGPRIALVGSDGQHMRTVGRGTNPTWAPDAKSLGFLALNGAITIVDAASGAVRQTIVPPTPFDHPADGLAWSPDGTRFAFTFVDDEETKPVTHLAVINVDGTGAHRLTGIDTWPDSNPDWQPLCTIYGTDSNDVLRGTNGADVICGLRGDDTIRAGDGNDTVIGGDGADIIDGGYGSDRLFGSGGADQIHARDAVPDVVDGGLGTDRAWTDLGLDQTAHVEHVSRG